VNVRTTSNPEEEGGVLEVYRKGAVRVATLLANMGIKNLQVMMMMMMMMMVVVVMMMMMMMMMMMVVMMMMMMSAWASRAYRCGDDACDHQSLTGTRIRRQHGRHEPPGEAPATRQKRWKDGHSGDDDAAAAAAAANNHNDAPPLLPPRTR
jgi:hypothetical protein